MTSQSCSLKAMKGPWDANFLILLGSAFATSSRNAAENHNAMIFCFDVAFCSNSLVGGQVSMASGDTR